jgi:undecaprenyl phosphate-alpha-L-ara4N flippase subunit ArnE
MMGTLAPYYGALVVGICIAAGGQLLLKTGAMRGELVQQYFDLFTILGLGAYGTSAVLYIFALRKIPLSQAYPSVSISYAVVAVAAHYLWGERIGWGQAAGFLLIMSGILLVHRT